MATQSSYSETQPVATPGLQATMIPATFISRTVEDAAGIGFGKPVQQGTNPKGCKATPSATAILGITALDRSAAGANDTYRQYDAARIQTKGDCWVVANVQVAAGDPVYVIVASGLFTNSSSGNVLIPGARWDTSTAGATQLAVIRLG